MLQKEKIKVTPKNRKDIIHNHAMDVSNSMDMGTLIAFVKDTIEKNFSKLSNKEIEKIIDEYNPQILETIDDNNKSY
jgi:hypothetical protein